MPKLAFGKSFRTTQAAFGTIFRVLGIGTSFLNRILEIFSSSLVFLSSQQKTLF
jgi:hypothetical protein